MRQSQRVSEGESQPAACASFECTHLFSQGFALAKKHAAKQEFNFGGAHSSPQGSESRIHDCTRIRRAPAWPHCTLIIFPRFPNSTARLVHEMNFLARLQPFGLLALRIALGIIFITHGYPKLIRSNVEMQHMFVQHGLPAQFVYVAGVIEAFGGLLLALGLFVRPAALLLAIEMSVAIWKVHSSGGILAVHLYEFPFALGAACLALATVGAGAVSVDEGLLGSGAKRSRAPKKSRE